MGSRASLDGWKISSPPGFDPGQSSFTNFIHLINARNMEHTEGQRVRDRHRDTEREWKNTKKSM